MSERRPESPQAASLRERAEKAFRERPDATLENLDALSPEARRASLHELRVHQIELEIQNEELRRAHAALDALRSRYFDLYDLAPVGYCTFGEKGPILEANLTATTLLRVERGALVGKSLSDFISKEGQELYYWCRKNILETRQPQECDLRIVRPDGTAFFAHLNFTVARDENGAPVYRVALVDVTALKQAEEEMSSLRTAVEQGESSIVITDLLGNIEYVNPAFEKITGYTAAEVVGKNSSMLKSGEQDTEFYRHLWATIRLEKNWRGEFHNRRKDGSLYWEAATISPVQNDRGETIRYLAIKEDITERKRTEEELLKKSSELELFTTAVSHDLKSPLVTIKAFLGYLEKDLNDPGERAKDLGYIHGAADKMARLLDDLLALARIGHLRDETVVLPLQEVAREALAIVAGQIAERGVHVEITSEPILLHGDRLQLVAVFQNLLDNAVKFLGDQPDPRIEIGAETESGGIVLFVRDNGKGISPCDQPKIFGLFQKLDEHTPGSGIGLAIVRRIVEAHGGKIQAQSDGPGKGTTFGFTLKHTQIKSS